MNVDNFELIKNNIKKIKKYIKLTDSKCNLSTYHLITDNSQIDIEVDQYKKNIIEPLATTSYIWKMHNWSGNYENTNPRIEKKKRSCGRPFAPELTVRAGGEEGKSGAVVPCCQTLGPPNEEKSILGHISESSVEEIWNGEKYKKLREAHRSEKFEDIDYCKNCDFLIEDPEVLVWSNDKSAKLNHMLGTPNDFILTDKKHVK